MTKVNLRDWNESTIDSWISWSQKKRDASVLNNFTFVYLYIYIINVDIILNSIISDSKTFKYEFLV